MLREYHLIKGGIADEKKSKLAPAELQAYLNGTKT